MEINPKIGLFAIALTAIPVGTIAATAENPSAVTVLPPPATSTCTGVVYDHTGETVIGASIRVVGTKLGTVTDIDGKFSLANVPNGATIEISYIGYTPQQVKFTGKPLNITLKEDATHLDEVVVMGYGVAQKRAKVTNSIAKVSEKTLNVGANANPAQALAGAVAGVKVDITSGSPSATPSITIRGGSNYDGGSNEPLVIVDGVIRSSLSDINPNDIESMEVMKDAGATALYGARAGNGVIMITTKQGKNGKASVSFNAKVGLNYYNLGYNMCSDEDFLYYYRLAIQNCQWTLPGGANASAYNSNLYGTNTPGGIGRTELSQGQSYNILRKTDDNAYLLQKGWKEMLDPVSDNYILYRNIDPL